MEQKEPIKLEETYYSINGILYKADIFGDLWFKDGFGVWNPVKKSVV